MAEGLAVHFSTQITLSEPKPWCLAVQGKKLEELKEKAREEFDNEDYDYYGWFFGVQRDNIPKWAGHSIAYSLVGDYLNQTKNQPPNLPISLQMNLLISKTTSVFLVDTMSSSTLKEIINKSKDARTPWIVISITHPLRSWHCSVLRSSINWTSAFISTSKSIHALS